jgi:nitronate monooxygenase
MIIATAILSREGDCWSGVQAMSKFDQAKWKNSRVATRLKIRYPIVQGAFGGFASEPLTAEVSNFGGLGSFGAHSQTPSAMRESIAKIRSLTSQPFAVNLWVSMEDEGAFGSGEADFERARAHIAPYLQELSAPLPDYRPYEPVKFEDQAQALLEARIPVFSFIFGIPRREILDAFRQIGTVLIGGATTVAEARALEDAGVDLVVASGLEAGGHRGSFLRPAEESLTGTFALVPQVADAIRLPVIAAGGIADARGVVAALVLGADAVQMGTAFLACEGSGATEMHRSTILKGDAAQTGLTRGFTGRLARGVRNRMMEEWEKAPDDILPYPLQRQLMRSLSLPAQASGRADLVAVWVGQSASLCHHTNASEFLDSLVREVEEKLSVF